MKTGTLKARVDDVCNTNYSTTKRTYKYPSSCFFVGILPYNYFYCVDEKNRIKSNILTKYWPNNKYLGFIYSYVTSFFSYIINVRYYFITDLDIYQ